MARSLCRAGISPNTVSLCSILFATAAAAGFLMGTLGGETLRRPGFLLAALGIQLRLLCNLLDGMVAVEGGRRTPSGELFNEFPDRISDSLILVAAGGTHPIGWLAALLALLTAYTRALGVSAGAPHVFLGPMAKPQRMALMTLAALAAAAAPRIDWITPALLLVCAGAAVTVIRRLSSIRDHLEAA